MKADRLLSILVCLQNEGKMTARELAERLEVSERTICRDMESLSAAGIPVYAERGPQGGWALTEGYRTRLTGMTQQELLSLLLLQPSSALEQLGIGEGFETALQKVLAASPESLRHYASEVRGRIHVDGTAWYALPEQVRCLPAVRQAVWECRKLAIVYPAPAAGSPTFEPGGHAPVAGSPAFGRDGYAPATGSSAFGPGGPSPAMGSSALGPGGPSPAMGSSALGPGRPAPATGSPASRPGSPASTAGSPALGPGSPASATGDPAQQCPARQIAPAAEASAAGGAGDEAGRAAAVPAAAFPSTAAETPLLKLIVLPLGLVAKRSVWYMIAQPAEGGDIVFFRVSRLIDAQLLAETFARPDGFDLAAYWRQATEQFVTTRWSYTVRMRLQEDMLPYLPPERRARMLASRQLDDGWLEVEMAFRSPAAARSAVFALGRFAEVLEPAGLRAELLELARAVAAMYSGGR